MKTKPSPQAGHEERSQRVNCRRWRRSNGSSLKLSKLAAGVLAAVTVGVVGASAGQASAYTLRYDGVVANVGAPASTGFNRAVFNVPSVTVNRSASAVYGNAQRVDVTYYLQYRVGNTWHNAQVRTQTGWIQMGSNSVTVAPITLTPEQFPFNYGAWRVAYGVQWFSPWHPTPDVPTTVQGTMAFAPSATSDLRCGTSRCVAYPGYLWLT